MLCLSVSSVCFAVIVAQFAAETCNISSGWLPVAIGGCKLIDCCYRNTWKNEGLGNLPLPKPKVAHVQVLST